MQFELLKNGKAAPIILEECAIDGMDFMTDIFRKDVELVTGVLPDKKPALQEDTEAAVLVATCGYSKYLEKLEEEGVISLVAIRGKREVYGIFPVCYQEKPLLIIAGSDKRGTIYGMFSISEKMGVSPWLFWADAVPAKKAEVVFDESIAVISKEPSVKYRGFFINDEQPCLGNWAKEKYGSCRPCPEMYEHIFELLLRLKGNYLWPAMWRSDFTLDHIENAILADKMGVIVGASHHEPCCRSGQEFQTLRREHPEYGTEWSFLSNAEGVSAFWRDGLLRNKPYESLITIGMRGESDSYLMPEDATLEDNINVLKAAITEQKKLIAEYGNQAHPQLLAIYKEVEDYYHGDETTPGLKEWDVLKDDIMMLCDDNFANLRTMPEKPDDHPGGYGMYYHFDYFGSPVSYLWINTSPLVKTWEQMSMAYDFGVREAWIVNVGDIKNQELALSYFIDLAYDFDKWGTAAPNTTGEYTKQWLMQMGFTHEKYAPLAQVVEEYIRLNGMCRPEVLKADTYHPVHFGEAAAILERADKIADITEKLYAEMEEADPLKDCFFEVIYYPVMACVNIIRMQIYAGFNHYYVKQHKKLGNSYIPKVEECIKKDRELTRMYHTLGGGRWNHMQSVYHIGYTRWNDEEWQYPTCQIYYPVPDPRLGVNIGGEEFTTGGKNWSRSLLTMSLAEKAKPCGTFDVSNGGEGVMEYHITWESDLFDIVPLTQQACDVITGKEIRAKIEDVATYQVQLKEDAVSKAAELGVQSIYIYGDNCEETADSSENEGSINRVEIQVKIEKLPEDLEAGVFLAGDGYVSIEAPHFVSSKEVAGAEWQILEDFGKTLGGVKAFPVTKTFGLEEEAPVLEYRVYVPAAGAYDLELFTAPSNPVVYKGKMCVAVAVNEGAYEAFNTIPDEGYVPWLSPTWAEGVLCQIHKQKKQVALKAGENSIFVKAMDPAVVLEKLVLAEAGTAYPASYLGPVESYRK